MMPSLTLYKFILHYQGGNGTVGWILARVAEAYPSGNNPPVGICSLGTGSDLSRVLTWSEQYEIPLAQIVALDLWGVQLGQLDTSAVV